MRNRSKIISILLATAMAGSMLAGCGGGNNEENNSGSSESSSEQASESKEKDTSVLAEGSDNELTYKGELSLMALIPLQKNQKGMVVPTDSVL